MVKNFQEYKYKTGRERRVVDLKSGNILEISVNAYDMDTLSANFLDVDGYYSSVSVNEENYTHFPFVSDYIEMPENKAIFRIVYDEIQSLKNHLRQI